MKRLYIVLTIFLSSFFFLSSSKVKAAETTYYVPSELTSVIENNYQTMVNTADNFINNDSNYSDLYFIDYVPNNQEYWLTVLSSDFRNDLYSMNDSSWGFGIWGVYFPNKFVIYVYSQDFTSVEYSFDMDSAYILSNEHFIVSSNFPLSSINPYTEVNPDTVTYVYEEHNYTFDLNTNTGFKTVYEMYEDVHGEPDTPIVNNPVDDFYTIIISKIILLGNDFANNSILLTLVVICILIFLFELIFRRHL